LGVEAGEAGDKDADIEDAGELLDHHHRGAWLVIDVMSPKPVVVSVVRLK
jgi:hypothetical protein